MKKNRLLFLLVFLFPFMVKSQVELLDTISKSKLIVSITDTSILINFYSHYSDINEKQYLPNQYFVNSVIVLHNKLKIKLNENSNTFVIGCTKNYDSFDIHEILPSGKILSQNKVKLGMKGDSFIMDGIRFYFENRRIVVISGNLFLSFNESVRGKISGTNYFHVIFDNHCGEIEITGRLKLKKQTTKVFLDILGSKKCLVYLRKFKYKIDKSKF